ncbi:hypothetical protein [uncultured Muribaculum sp.]|uniref:hypothetical protein n=1 Tax=uncultured Muribaculum sp. TaxID=1918613 RepID=UPI0025F66893|nr:hypothetical protein [uncultured Muribaculum sp.]
MAKFKIKNVEDRFTRIKGYLDKISDKEIEEYSKIDHPLFSFKYLCDVSYPACSDSKFFRDFLSRLAKLSELGWAEIRQSAPHSFGMEPIPVKQMVHKAKLPGFVSADADLHVFRAVGDNRTFAGLQVGKIFYIFFIEAKFNDIYPHGKKK